MPSRQVTRARAAISAALCVAVLLPAAPASAAAPPPCPLVADAVVIQAVGVPVSGGIMTDFVSDTPLETGPNKTVCWWDSPSVTVTLARETGAFGPGGAANPAEMARSLFQVPAAAAAEVDALNQAGVSDIHLPDWSMSNASGIGDAAVWVYQNDPTLNVPSGGFVVQRGTDAFTFGIIGNEEELARTRATALAQAVLSAPQ